MRLISCISALALFLSLSACACDESGEGISQNEPISISAEEAHSLISSDRTLVLDVRGEEEFRAEHIPNAINIPLDCLDEASISSVVSCSTEPIYVYCRTGVRSANAADRLAKWGYTKVYDFGGIEDWPFETIKCKDPNEVGTVENDQLPVGVKVVCGKTRALPDDRDGN